MKNIPVVLYQDSTLKDQVVWKEHLEIHQVVSMLLQEQCPRNWKNMENFQGHMISLQAKCNDS